MDDSTVKFINGTVTVKKGSKIDRMLSGASKLCYAVPKYSGKPGSVEVDEDGLIRKS